MQKKIYISEFSASMTIFSASPANVSLKATEPNEDNRLWRNPMEILLRTTTHFWGPCH